MSKLKMACYVACLALFMTLVGGLLAQPAAFAMSKDAVSTSSFAPSQAASTEEQIKLDSKYPTISSYAGSYFSYDIDLSYTGGKEPRTFDLRVAVPQGFTASIAPSYGDSSSEIRAIRLDPTKNYPDTIKVTVRPAYTYLVPEPGEYPVTVEASFGTIKGSIQLKAVVTAKYDMSLDPAAGRFNVKATAGKDSYFTISVTNTGTADLNNIVFSSTVRGAPSGWSVTFKPEKIDLLKLGDTRDVEVNIKPASKTIAGDYMVNISSAPEAKNAYASAEMRVTVVTSPIWGWIGVGIVALVIVGLAVMFMRLGRR